jgi:DNA-binding NarL/FixJ family response regulator
VATGVFAEGHERGHSRTEDAVTAGAVVLLDVHMPDGGGVEVIRQVAPEAARSAFSGAVGVRRRGGRDRRDPRAGARGYVTKAISGEELADAVRRVHGGDAVFSPRLAGVVLDAFAGASQPAPTAGAEDPELDQLTAREREVLQHIARGYMYKESPTR